MLLQFCFYQFASFIQNCILYLSNKFLLSKIKISKQMQSQKTLIKENRSQVPPSTPPHPIAFVIDIDGTLQISHKQIPGSSQALNFLTHHNIPHLFLTNNISHSQESLAQQLNQNLHLSKPIRSQQVILNYTPTKGVIQWEETTVLLVGREVRFEEILPLRHVPKWVTIEEYCAMFVDDVPLGRREKGEKQETMRKLIGERLGLKEVTKETLKFGAILIICCPVNWEESMQVIMDILNSPNGAFPLHKTSYSYEPNHIPIMATNNDLLYMVSNCNLPRILIRPFNQMIKSTFKQIFGHELQMKIFGKPQIETFKFTEKHCEKLFGKVERFVMIGDNPQIDIEGAVNAGWDGILLKSGVATCDMAKAKVNTTNLLEGIKEYLQKQQPDFYLTLSQ